MKAMVLTAVNKPLELLDLPRPEPLEDEILIKILYCGVCRTELDQIEGRIYPPKLPVIPGHQPVGIVEKIGTNVSKFKIGDIVGATWLYSSCGYCEFCKKGNENLCKQFKGTGCHADGGYAEYMVISEKYAFKIPSAYTDFSKVAPLLCGGVIGYRSLKLANITDGEPVALWGFGSSNHQLFQIIKMKYKHSPIFVFTRNVNEQELAMKMGAEWVGWIDDKPPKNVNKAIYTIPAWLPFIKALENLERGGRLIINLIRMNDDDKINLLNINYSEHLWLEKEIKTVANVSLADAEEFLSIAAEIPIIPEVQIFNLEEANLALLELKSGKIKGSKVLKIN
ncbi:MAG: zinc-dependent alcohol dehydrogenase family protein [Bacteroidales bacterium]|nr:zinc-dependent alcohol dehydrogenase family protein [Bacteroidales bacterium]